MSDRINELLRTIKEVNGDEPCILKIHFGLDFKLSSDFIVEFGNLHFDITARGNDLEQILENVLDKIKEN